MTEHFKNTLCGDCGSPDPQWATINRGLLLCNECCSVHRSLGPQCSRVKSLKNSQWSPNLSKMLETLASGCANHVWEHNLLDPSKSDLQMRKPGPYDALETVKKPFIQAKHFQFQFVLRQKAETFEERNQELHSTVRTGDLGTTLRLLASGADPNFFHPEKGTRPLHVAARTGQALQVELLFLHGAHTDAPDYLGQTPVEHALVAGFRELAQRIIELRYHLTDYLSRFACNEAPDHSTSKHIIIPNLKYVSRHEVSVKRLPSHVLEQLASDLYDEVDRRQLEAYVLATSLSDVTKFSIAFLPVDPHFSSVRNQTRQKFARLTEDELASLITLVLIESKRRHCGDSTDATSAPDRDIFRHSESHLMNKFNDTGSATKTHSSAPAVSVSTTRPVVQLQIAEDDDYPLYDCVASDDDLILTEHQAMLSQQRPKIEETLSTTSAKPGSNCDSGQLKEFVLASKLVESEAKIQELQDCNQNLKLEILVLQRMIGSVIHENLDMKSYQLQNLKDAVSAPNLVHAQNGTLLHSPEPQVVKSRPPRPMSLCESRLEKDNGLPIRPNTTEVCLQKGQSSARPIELVQDATRKIVELIKILIEYAQSNDFQGVQLTASKIYIEAQGMASALIVKETRRDVKICLENVLFQVLRMKSEVILLSEQNQSKSIIRYSSADSSCDFLQKVKQICFEVGAAMKQLVFTTMPSSYHT